MNKYATEFYESEKGLFVRWNIWANELMQGQSLQEIIAQTLKESHKKEQRYEKREIYSHYYHN